MLRYHRKPPSMLPILEDQTFSASHLVQELGPDFLGLGASERKDDSTFGFRDGHPELLQDVYGFGNRLQYLKHVLRAVEYCLKESVVSIPRTVFNTPVLIYVVHSKCGKQGPDTWCYSAALAYAPATVYTATVLLMLNMVLKASVPFHDKALDIGRRVADGEGCITCGSSESNARVRSMETVMAPTSLVGRAPALRWLSVSF